MRPEEVRLVQLAAECIGSYLRGDGLDQLVKQPGDLASLAKGCELLTIAAARGLAEQQSRSALDVLDSLAERDDHLLLREQEEPTWTSTIEMLKLATTGRSPDPPFVYDSPAASSTLFSVAVSVAYEFASALTITPVQAAEMMAKTAGEET